MPTRIAVIDRNICIRAKCGYLCAKVCPPNRMGEECITVEKESDFPVISEELCIGCGLCVKKCPVSCITIINLAGELEDPIYQYGINAFRLYGLPLPKEGGAVSLVGKNGIGKTTAIRLLSRQLRPNFASFGTELTDAQMLGKLSMEVRRYFEGLTGELRISSKPQYIDRIRELSKGTVRTLLKSSKAGDAKIEEAVRTFALDEILSRRISQLSGGELQKAAIATAWLKDADIYYFDEVTNYLDIEERLRMAVILRDLAERKSVLMAEHDLTILDYVSTYVYLLYGEENTYGVVSHVKNARSGINEYLGGFLKDENVRFRDIEIEFSRHSESEIKTAAVLKYEPLSKSFGSGGGFSFTSDAGELRKGEILGLVGKNALGKSLFVKMLAGVEKPDSGLAISKKVSYKPQYISAEEVQVQEMFASRKIEGAVFEEAKRRLKLGPLMEKKLTELSGGELQRVACTLALSQEADIYLFDEPSAFLDIEQRFEFAKLLRSVISESEKAAFVVDHDIVFVDAIANRLVVFDGHSSVKGHASKPMDKREGMNGFLKVAGVTMRRDKDTNRPRINKPGSQLDAEQKAAGEYFYFERK